MSWEIEVLEATTRRPLINLINEATVSESALSYTQPDGAAVLQVPGWPVLTFAGDSNSTTVTTSDDSWSHSGTLRECCDALYLERSNA